MRTLFNLIIFGIFTITTIPLHVFSQPQTKEPHLSLFGTTKYVAEFPHFDYVNPNAPKGGKITLNGFGHFDSFNPFIIKGRPAEKLHLMYDTLTVPALDEYGTQYGLLAQDISYPEDISSATFTLNSKARFHDGVPVKPEDVIWSFQQLVKNHPFYRTYYANVKTVEKLSSHAIRFIFTKKYDRELPQIVGQFPILPKHYWTRKNRDISKTTLEPPIGSGPYRLKHFEARRYVLYERDPKYWGKNLNVTKGYHNFHQIQVDYFNDPTVAFEALKAGSVTYRAENNSKNWATGYNIPAIKTGKLIRKNLPNKNVQGMQGFAFNIRHKKFQNPQVREAFNLAFNFEWINKNLFYKQYKRTDSYFDNSILAAKGLPSNAELTLLNPIRKQIPERVFTTAFTNPIVKKDSDLRHNLRRAKNLLTQAGWKINDRKLMKNGQVLRVEFLIVQPAFKRIIAPFIKNLTRLGIEANIRQVDAAQYQNRLNNFDFDIIVHNFGQSLTPGYEQRNYWGSQAAKQQGGQNVIGIENNAIDHLINHVILAKTREEKITATHALDRVLLAYHFVIPHWHIAYHRLAYWEGLHHPKKPPPYSTGFPEIWWKQ